MTIYHIYFIFGVAKAGLMLLTFLASASFIHGVFRRLMTDTAERGLLAAIALTIGPLLLSWVTVQALYYAPGQSREFYLGLIGLVIVLPGIILSPGFIDDIFNGLKTYLMRQGTRPIALIISFAFIGICILLLGQLVSHRLVVPIWGNDAQEYAQLSRWLVEQMSVRDYPLMDSSQTDGLMAPWSHPLGYTGLQIIARLIEGGDGSRASMLISLLTPYFAASGAIAVASITSVRQPGAASFAAFILISTPIFFNLAVQSHIDITRIAAFTTAFIAVWMMAKNRNIAFAVLAAIAAGMSQFTHSIGFLTLPLLVPLYLLMTRDSLMITARNASILVVVSLLFVIVRLIINVQEFGVPLGDYAVVWEIEALRELEHREVVRFLYTPYDQIMGGALRAWTDLENFGYTYTLATIGVLILVIAGRRQIFNLPMVWQTRAWRNDHPVMSAIIVVGGFFALVFLTLAAGSDLVVKNPRYVMTMTPLIAVIAADIILRPIWDNTRLPEQLTSFRGRDTAQNESGAAE
jgi:hypothetical protein